MYRSPIHRGGANLKHGGVTEFRSYTTIRAGLKFKLVIFNCANDCDDLRVRDFCVFDWKGETVIDVSNTTDKLGWPRIKL